MPASRRLSRDITSPHHCFERTADRSPGGSLASARTAVAGAAALQAAAAVRNCPRSAASQHTGRRAPPGLELWAPSPSTCPFRLKIVGEIAPAVLCHTLVAETPTAGQPRRGSSCGYASAPLSSTSAASLASSSRTNGVRPVMPATASNSDREASPSSRNSNAP
jgi:hypothetical protein